MVTVKLSQKPLAQAHTDAIVFFVPQDFSFSEQLKDACKHYFDEAHLKAHMEKANFTGALGTLFQVPSASENRIITLMLVGCGKAGGNKTIPVENFRRAVGKAVKTMEAHRITTATCVLPSADTFGVDSCALAKELTVIGSMAAYIFDDYITDPLRKTKQNITLEIDPIGQDSSKLEEGIKVGSIIGGSINAVRHWVDTPPSHLTPQDLAGKAREVAARHDLKITVFSEKEINSMGMGGLSAVSAGSHQDCQLVIMEYKSKKENAPTLAIVGKGITFDSGGLSLKPPSYMETMKEDMSGAAAVIGTMDILAALKPDINVIMLAPMSENLPSGVATKPGDIATFYNGKTAEIRNTDAEGRLILADALSYAVKHYKPDAIIDIATLTGACAHALGPFFSGLMSQHDDLAKRIEKAACVTGDRVWRLPMDSDYRAAIVSNVADICNIGNEKIRAGAITAAFFLKEFVDDVPWAHLDIAGTAFDVPDITYYRRGSATGASVRLLVEVAMSWNKS